MFVLALFALLFSSLVVAQDTVVDNSSAFVRITHDGTSGSVQVQTTLSNLATVLKVQATRVDLEADLLTASVKPLADKALSFTGATGASFTSTAGDANISSNDRHVLTIASTEVINATPSNTTFTGFVHTKMVSAPTGDLALRGALDVTVSAGTADDTKQFSFMYNGALGHTVTKDTVTSAGALSLVSDKGDISISTSGTAKTLTFESSNGNAKVVFASTGVSIVGLQDAVPTTKADSMTASAGNKLVFSGENVNIVATAGDVAFGSEVTVGKTKSVTADADLVLGAPSGKKVIFQNDATSVAFLDSTKLSIVKDGKLSGAAALTFSASGAGNMVLQANSASAKTTVSAEGVSAFTYTGGADGLQFNLPLTFPSTAGETTFSTTTTVTGLATFEDNLTVPGITGTGTDALTVEATNDLKLHVKNAAGVLNIGTSVASLSVAPAGVTVDQAATMNAATKIGGALDIKAATVTVLAGKSISGAGALEYKATGNLDLKADSAAATADIKIAGTSVAKSTATGTTFQGTAGFTTTAGEAEFTTALNAQGEAQINKDSTFTTISGTPLKVTSGAALEIDSTTTTIGNTAVPEAITIDGTSVAIGDVKTTFEKGISVTDGIDLDSAEVTALKGLSITSSAAGLFTLNSDSTVTFSHDTAAYLEVSETAFEVKDGYALNFAKKVTTTGDINVGNADSWVSEGTVTLTGGLTANVNNIVIGTSTTPSITATSSGTGTANIGSAEDYVKVTSTGTEIEVTADGLEFESNVTFSSTASFTGGLTCAGNLTFDGSTISASGSTLTIRDTTGALELGSATLDEMTFTAAAADAKVTMFSDGTNTIGFDDGDLISSIDTYLEVDGGVAFKGIIYEQGSIDADVDTTANVPVEISTITLVDGVADEGACWGAIEQNGQFALSCSIDGTALSLVALSPGMESFVTTTNVEFHQIVFATA